MSNNIRFLSEVDEDVSDAYLWYEDKRLGLGEAFLEELEALFPRIEKRPNTFPPEERPVRKALLDRFPYKVLFRQEEDGIITIIAVFHTSRDPKSWKGRD
jgi:toxin ParE1/3/4